MRTTAALIVTVLLMFAALKEQLGLTLERVRVPIDYLVVDAISQPEPD